MTTSTDSGHLGPIILGMAFLPKALIAAIAVANAGFEDQTDGKVMAWRIPPEMQVVRGAGHNGSAGLVWKSSSPSTRRVAASQTFPIAPGKAYHFSALMRATGFVGHKGAKIDASVLDANGKVLSEHYPRGIKSSTDWMRVDGLVDAPPSAAKMRLLLSVLPGSSGEVAFDDILVEPKELEVAAFAFSSGYRDEMVAGPVTFTGFIRLPAKQTVDTIRAAFVCRGADGAERRLPAALSVEADEVYATAQTETALLAEGTQQIRFVVADQSGRVLGESDFTFRRVSALPKRRVGIDAYGRCLVNGEPFFPIGMYSHKLSEADAAAYATGPFNSIVVYGLSDRDDLARLAKHGIWYVPTLKNELVGRKQAVERGIHTVAESDAFFRAEIAKLKDAPNLLGWYVCDEAPLTELEARRRLYALYRQCDDDHPCWAVMDKLERIREWVSICDVYGVDPYPICGRPMARITDFCAGVRRSTRGGRAFWNVPQNFNWAWYGRAETRGVANRMPTTEEMAFINWCHIASGANGLFGYTFAAIRQEESKGRGKLADFQKHWQSICAAYADVRRLAPVLLSVEPTPTPPTVATETPVRLWRKDGSLYVLACNASDTTRTLSVTLDGFTHLEGIELGNAVSVRVAEGKVLFELPSVGYSMARLKEECKRR